MSAMYCTSPPQQRREPANDNGNLSDSSDGSDALLLRTMSTVASEPFPGGGSPSFVLQCHHLFHNDVLTLSSTADGAQQQCTSKQDRSFSFDESHGVLSAPSANGKELTLSPRSWCIVRAEHMT